MHGVSVLTPSNVVSQRYRQRIDAWVYPYFEQNWQLFAPDPQSVLQHVWARTATTSPSGTRQAGDWVDLTASDAAAVRHVPFPSHTAQNMLRRAWTAYADAQGTGGRSDSERARMLQQYLLDIATQRLAVHGHRAFDRVRAPADGGRRELSNSGLPLRSSDRDLGRHERSRPI